MPDKPTPLPRPAHRVTIDLMGKRYALDVKISPLPDAPAEVVEMPPETRFVKSYREAPRIERIDSAAPPIPMPKAEDWDSRLDDLIGHAPLPGCLPGPRWKPPVTPPPEKP